MMRRHDHLWVSPDAVLSTARKSEPPDEDVRDAARRWRSAGWPFVVPRQTSAGWPDLVLVGMPLPPSLGKRRIGLEVSARSIVRSRAPPRLDHLIARLPAARQPALRRLSDALSAIGVELGVYGSFAWEALTGMSYVTSESDIDLLFRPADIAQLDRATALLSAWERESWRVDGEVLFSDDLDGEVGVSWREWVTTERKSAGAKSVLAKSLLAVRLRDIGDLRSTLEQHPREGVPCSSV
jgi:phosphoribosyl-dephospho-CoA transferase